MTAPYHLPNAFQTARFNLRRVVEGDAPALFEAYTTDAEVMRYLGWKPHQCVDETAEFLRGASAEWDKGTGFAVVASRRDQPTDLIGMFHPRLIGHCVRYGYVLKSSVWGQGIASEIMIWLVNHALAHPEIFRAEAFCDVDNPASARVMEKAGMTQEGTLRRYFRHPNISDEPRDCVIYSKVL
ncbi:GNAT family N-acetyltransferase [Pseudosulfitobacter sp. DSM 107133]|uniref:GNAT family N-acetyltransferase n=1 Tax=Pseudosulfitobacter sp. DSM 107133 TaxID=2883100 RepID=UPI000DF22D9F|nr:GNAT family N-acetyltransferase [Pseudosulfitobacter sp. DSM 107133]UOA26247.1 Ribosomal-protein-serine acetyltransferase [Pseudosulfitobacter sp. DSM 107133]